MTNNTKENTMNETLGSYHGKPVVVIDISEYWNEALVRYAHPESNNLDQSTIGQGSFKIGLPLLKPSPK